MKRYRKIGIIVIAVLIVAVGFWIFRSKGSTSVSFVVTEKPQRGDISKTVITTGTLQPVNTVSVGSQVSGTIEKLYVDYNSVVKAGDLLAQIDKTLFQASLDQALSSYSQVKSELNYQKSNYERQSQLYEVGAISKAEYENAVCTYNSAVAQADVAAAQVQSARKNLNLTSIYSPIDGTILSRSVSEGQTVAASFSTPTIFSIAKDLTKMQVEASVDEADIGSIKEGDKVVFTVDAFTEDKFTGTVQQIRLNPTTTNNVVTYTTIIQTSNEDLKLKPGMTANITIYTKEVKGAMLIPAKALEFTPDSTLANYQIMPLRGPNAEQGQTIWTLEGQKLVQKAVRTGLNNKTLVEVQEGLSENEYVAVETVSNGTAAAVSTPESSSPFMPKRPGSNRNKK